MHDIYYGTALPPNRGPIPILRPADRIGEPYFRCPPEKIVAIVLTDSPTATPFQAARCRLRAIAGHVMDFLSRGEAGPPAGNTAAASVGVGNIANAVLAGLDDGPFRPLTAYTEVIQDGMLGLLRSGTLASRRRPRYPSARRIREFKDNIDIIATGSCCARRRSATTPK